MKLKYQISLFVIITLLVINSTLATSYSLWTISRTQTGSNLITAGCFEISYNDLDSNNVSTNINLNNTYPISDALGVSQKPYKLTITNTCTVAADYKLLISELNGNTLDNSNIKYYLTKNDGTNFGPTAFSGLTSYTMDNSIKSNIETEKNVSIKNSYVLATGYLNPSDSITYELRLWIKQEATNEVKDKRFDSIVSFEAYATETQS